MNRLKTIILFAGIFGIGLGAVSLSGMSAISMVSAAPQTQDNFGMLGHVEYKLLDQSGSIKQYLQSDNVVVLVGKDCVSRLVFDNSTSVVCPNGNNVFQYIAIGNHTTATPPANTLEALELTGGTGCADTDVDGEMARKLVPVVFVAATGGTGTVVTLDTQASPFDFGVGNSTGPIMQSGVFNTDNIHDGNGQCSTLNPSSMFAVQDLNLDTGITVSDGDSLSVKWTITVG